MRFLIFPLLMFICSFWILRTVGVWSTKKNWKRIGLELATATGAAMLMGICMFLIVTFLN